MKKRMLSGFNFYLQDGAVVSRILQQKILFEVVAVINQINVIEHWCIFNTHETSYN